MSDFLRSCASMILVPIAALGLQLVVPSTGWTQQQLVVGADFGANPYIIASPDGTVSASTSTWSRKSPSAWGDRA